MSLFNKIFSLINQTRYFIYESILLKFIRLKKKNIYLKKDPLVEIILPTYNRSEMLKTRSIPSVLKQTYKNFRLSNLMMIEFFFTIYLKEKKDTQKQLKIIGLLDQ